MINNDACSPATGAGTRCPETLLFSIASDGEERNGEKQFDEGDRRGRVAASVECALPAASRRVRTGSLQDAKEVALYDAGHVCF